MQATSGDSKQNLTASFWLGLRLSSKKVRFVMGTRSEGGCMPSRTWMRGVICPDLSSYITR